MVGYYACLWFCDPLDFDPTIMIGIELNWDEEVWLFFCVGVVSVFSSGVCAPLASLPEYFRYLC